MRCKVRQFVNVFPKVPRNDLKYAFSTVLKFTIVILLSTLAFLNFWHKTSIVVNNALLNKPLVEEKHIKLQKKLKIGSHVITHISYIRYFTGSSKHYLSRMLTCACFDFSSAF